METINLLNSCITPFKKLSDLLTDKKYYLIKFSVINTRFGDSILVSITDSEEPIILPKRYSTLIPKIDDLNKSFEDGRKFMIPGKKNGNYIPISFGED